MNSRKIIVSAALAWLSAASATHAEEDPEACAAVSDDDARLECFDLIYRKSAGEIPTDSAWELYEEISKIDDSRNVYLSLDSTTYHDRFNNPKTVTLAIACREHATNLWFIFDEFMSDHQGAGEITYRIDKAPARTRNFEESTDNHALGLWSGGSAIPFAKQLLGAGSLLVRARPYSENWIQVEFQVAGLEQAIAPLRKACSW